MGRDVYRLHASPLSYGFMGWFMPTVAQLRTIFREDYADDDVGLLEDDKSLSSASFLRHLNHAQREAAQRSKLIWDQDSLRFPLISGVQSYAVDKSILQLEKAWFLGHPLKKITRSEYDQQASRPSPPSGAPTQFFIHNRTLYLDKLPTAAEDGTDLVIGAYRLPLEMTGDCDSPEIDDIYHEKLLHWVCWKAFSTADPDSTNEKFAQVHYALFEGAFGKAVSADVWQHQMEQPRRGRILPRSYY